MWTGMSVVGGDFVIQQKVQNIYKIDLAQTFVASKSKPWHTCLQLIYLLMMTEDKRLLQTSGQQIFVNTDIKLNDFHSTSSA